MFDWALIYVYSCVNHPLIFCTYMATDLQILCKQLFAEQMFRASAKFGFSSNVILCHSFSFEQSEFY
jgi:hypothetical protein